MEMNNIIQIESVIDFKPKFFINKKENIIHESLIGNLYQNKDILFYSDSNILIDKSQLDTEKVRLICGGGSGHEPSHSGFVMEGMLTAAVCGDIYSSPSYKNIQRAIDLVYSPKGLIILVKNYGGDIINFSLAIELSKAQGKKVEILIVDDDISLSNLNKCQMEDSENEKSNFSQRRGLCGIVYLYKILGSMCKDNFSFEEILQVGKNIIPSLYTLGVSLTSSVTPFSCKEDMINEISYSECEIGLGIHGEKGKERIKYKTIEELIKYCFINVFEVNMKKEFFDNFISDKRVNELKNINIIINNLGSCTDIEMNIIFYSLKKFIDKHYQGKMNVLRYFCGKFMTSLDMRGFSITLCDMDYNEFMKVNKDKILYHIDTKAKNNIFSSIDFTQNNFDNRIIAEENLIKNTFENKNSILKNLLYSLCHSLINQCDYLNHLDKEVADGDLGIGIEKGCSIILTNINFLNFEENLKTSFKKIGDFIATNCGGTSGPLIASFLIRGSDFLYEREDLNTKENWISFFNEGTRMMQNLGKAKLNDKTMLDILIPINDLLLEFKINNKENFNIKDLVKTINSSLDQLLENIKKLKSKKGRSSYQGGKEVGKDDPGCILVSIIIRFVINFIEKLA